MLVLLAGYKHSPPIGIILPSSLGLSRLFLTCLKNCLWSSISSEIMVQFFLLFWAVHVMTSEAILDLGISVWSSVAHRYHKCNIRHRAQTNTNCVTEDGISVKAQSAVVRWQANLSWLRIIVFISLHHSNWILWSKWNYSGFMAVLLRLHYSPLSMALFWL